MATTLRELRECLDKLSQYGTSKGIVSSALEDFQGMSNYVSQATVQLCFGESGDESYSVGFDPAKHALDTRFTHFADGVQRTIQVLTIRSENGGIPVYAGVRAAVVLRRENGVFSVWRESPCEVRLLLLASHAELLGITDDGLYETISEHQLGLNPNEPFDHSRLITVVKGHNSSRRHALEWNLTEEFVKHSQPGSMLYLDGTLDNAFPGVSVIGVAKTSRMLFLPLSYRTVYGLPEGHRSCAFLLPAVEPDELDDASHVAVDSPRLSWYLRLREPHHPTWGLVRVEASPDTTREQVDEISRFILAEREPPPTSDARWDRLVHGVYQCERYLKSIIPRYEVLGAHV